MMDFWGYTYTFMRDFLLCYQVMLLGIQHVLRDVTRVPAEVLEYQKMDEILSLEGFAGFAHPFPKG